MTFEDKTVITNYFLNPLTIMIEPHEYGRKNYSKILEFEKDILFSPHKPIDLVKAGCEHNFTDFNTCKKVAQRLIKTPHKTPIAVDPVNSVYMMPTVSPIKSECIWINFDHILDHTRNSANSTMIKLTNKDTIILPISYRSFRTQYFKTSELKNKITEKLKENEQRADFLRRKRYFDESLPSFINERYREM